MGSIRVRIFMCCVPAIFASGCTSADPCGGACEAFEVCIDGACEIAFVACNGDGDCADGQFCINGGCADACSVNDDCDPNELCVNGDCVECVNNANCAVNEFCSEGACVNEACLNSPFPCESVANCPVGCNATCTEGICAD